MLKDSATITTGTDTPKIAHTESRSGSSWDLNYPALVSLMNGQYYVEYYAIFGMMGIPIMLKAKWNKSIGWLGKNVNEIAEMTCEKVCHIIVSHAEKFNWVASYNRFYLTKLGHHSSNSSDTLHNVSSNKAAWFSHKRK